MPAGPHQAPILSCASRDQLRGLRQALAPERWPLPPALLPAEALLVGGAVRDGLLGRLKERPDLDLVVEGDAVALARDLARRCGGSCVVLDAERSIARLVLRGWSFDLARRMGGSLAEDLARRDYSINAIALPLACLQAADPAMERAGEHGLIDPGDGLADLRSRRVRALGESNLLEDPLRLLRGVRLACELEFTIEARTLAWIGAHRSRLDGVAGERVLAELERLAAAPGGAAGLRQTLALGLLGGWLGDDGDAPGMGEEAATTWGLRQLEDLTPGRAPLCGLVPQEASWALPLARLAAVLSPMALQRLRASRRLQQRCRRLRHWLRRLEEDRARSGPTATENARATATATRTAPPAAGLTLSGLQEEERLALQRELEEDLPALALRLDAAEARAALERWRDGEDPLFHPRPPLDGVRLQELLAIPPGRTLGALLDHLTRERAFGRLATPVAPDQVRQVARRWLAERG